jgi:hypothetical protein
MTFEEFIEYSPRGPWILIASHFVVARLPDDLAGPEPRFLAGVSEPIEACAIARVRAARGMATPRSRRRPAGLSAASIDGR